MSDAAMSVSNRQLTRNVNPHRPSVFPQSHMHPSAFPGCQGLPAVRFSEKSAWGPILISRNVGFYYLYRVTNRKSSPGVGVTLRENGGGGWPGSGQIPRTIVLFDILGYRRT